MIFQIFLTYAKIEYIYSYEDLKNKGFHFPSGLIMPATDFKKITNGVIKKDGKSICINL